MGKQLCGCSKARARANQLSFALTVLEPSPIFGRMIVRMTEHRLGHCRQALATNPALIAKSPWGQKAAEKSPLETGRLFRVFMTGSKSVSSPTLIHQNPQYWALLGSACQKIVWRSAALWTVWCGREDSNFHGLSATTTSTLRVYQFRHDRTALTGRRAPLAKG